MDSVGLRLVVVLVICTNSSPVLTSDRLSRLPVALSRRNVLWIVFNVMMFEEAEQTVVIRWISQWTRKSADRNMTEMTEDRKVSM
jgi:hypothetical protein